MNDAMKAEATALMKATGEARGFLMDETPKFVREMVAFSIVQTAVVFLLCCLVLIGFPLAVKFRGRQFWEFFRGESWEPAILVPIVFGTTAYIGAAVGSFVNGQALLMAYFAPRLYALSTLAGYLK